MGLLSDTVEGMVAAKEEARRREEERLRARLETLEGNIRALRGAFEGDSLVLEVTLGQPPQPGDESPSRNAHIYLNSSPPRHITVEVSGVPDASPYWIGSEWVNLNGLATHIARTVVALLERGEVTLRKGAGADSSAKKTKVKVGTRRLQIAV